MATNKLGPGTVNIGVNLPRTLRTRLERLAAISRPPKTLSAYVRDILRESAERGVIYEQTSHADLMVAEEQTHSYQTGKSSKKQTG